jgi:hypothetical protein
VTVNFGRQPIAHPPDKKSPAPLAGLLFFSPRRRTSFVCVAAVSTVEAIGETIDLAMAVFR